MTFQVADGKGALGSVHRICEAGNRVMFDDEGSYVECKTTGTRSVIDKVSGVYDLYLLCKKHQVGVDSVKEILGLARLGATL